MLRSTRLNWTALLGAGSLGILATSLLGFTTSSTTPIVMAPMNIPDSIGLVRLQEAPWLALNAPDPEAGAIVTRYLATLSGLGLNPQEQGVWLQSGPRLLAQNQGQQPLSAASLTKVATTLAALETWGHGHTFETLISTNGNLQNGVLQGDLIVHGTGDPMFVWEEAIALGHALNKLGIRQVTGELVLTGNFIMNFEFEPLKSATALKQALNSSTWSPEIQAQYDLLKPTFAKPQLAIAGDVRYQFATIPGRMLMRHQSLPLLHLVKRLNVHSNNVMAETLSRLLGGPQATAQRAAQAAGIAQSEILLANGSGLGVENRIAPHATTAMFTAIARYARRHGFTIADLFPISGTDTGTLIDRSLPKSAVVKTGTLNEVSALSGVLPTRDRGLVWFTVINRGSNIEGLRNQQDVLLSQLRAAWGEPKPNPTLVIPSAWVNNANTTLGALGRNEIVSGG